MSTADKVGASKKVGMGATVGGATAGIVGGGEVRGTEVMMDGGSMEFIETETQSSQTLVSSPFGDGVITTDEILSASQKYYDVIEKLLNCFAGQDYEEEVRFAKAEFFENAGILDETAPQYELRMSQFFDWYLFTREMKGFGVTPLQASFLSRGLRFNPQETLLIEQLRRHRHSIFIIHKIKNGDLYLKDLIRKEKVILKQCPYSYGFHDNEIFEARIIPYRDTYVFSRGFCFHPLEAKKFILREIRRHQKDPDLNVENMMLLLIKMRYKYERYSHVDISKIYVRYEDKEEKE